MPARPKVDIREVARVAGVSVTTVSHALNGKGRLPDETREHVRAVADDLGYRPNATARNLVGGKTGLLGLVVSQPRRGSFAVSDFTYFTEIMAAATASAMARGYALVLAPPDWGLGGAVAIDGAIVIDPLRKDSLVREFESAGTPVVTTGRVIEGAVELPWVDNDHEQATRRVMDHLTKRGARRIGLLTSPTRISYTVDVERAYAAWCAEHGVDPILKFSRADLTERSGYAAALEMLALDEPPDAIYATYDRLAYGVSLAAEATGVSIPEDLQLVMTATNSGTPQARPGITAIDLHPGEIGRRAADLLVDLIEGRDVEESKILIPTRLIARGSTSGHR